MTKTGVVVLGVCLGRVASAQLGPYVAETIDGCETCAGPPIAAFGMNEAGQVIVTVPNPEGGLWAFRWEAPSRMTHVGCLSCDDFDCTEDSTPLAINELGHVVGSDGYWFDNNHGYFNPGDEDGDALWDFNGAGDGFDSYGLDLDDSDQIVGRAKDVNRGGWIPVYWPTSDSFPPTRLSTNFGEARSVNSALLAVGWTGTYPALVPTAWSLLGGEFILPGGPGLANVVTDDGLIGGATAYESTLSYRPCLWENGELVELPLPEWSPRGEVLALSRGGIAVGRVFDPGIGDDRAALWSDGAIYLLDDLLADAGPRLRVANGINAAGWISCTGIVEGGQSRAIILIPSTEYECRSGQVNAGVDGNPVDVLFVDGSAGSGVRREITLEPGSHTVSVNRPPAGGSGHYGFWVIRGTTVDPLGAGVAFQTRNGALHDLGVSCFCLPVGNTIEAGSCPCDSGWRGFTSYPLGRGKAALLCLNARPAHPKAPISLSIDFPAGDWTVAGIVSDLGSPNEKPYSVANWISVRVP